MTIDKTDLVSKLEEIEEVISNDDESGVIPGTSRATELAGVIIFGVIVLAIWRLRRPKIRVEVYRG